MTENELTELISCQKIIVDPPRKTPLLENQSLKNEMRLTSIDGEHRFYVFIRQHVTFSENFSVGLVLEASSSHPRIPLIRCNGPHGPHRLWPHHTEYHIHTCNAELLNEGLLIESHARITKEYSSLDDAIYFFLKHCNIKDGIKHFPKSSSFSLFN